MERASGLTLGHMNLLAVVVRSMCQFERCPLFPSFSCLLPPERADERFLS